MTVSTRGTWPPPFSPSETCRREGGGSCWPPRAVPWRLRPSPPPLSDRAGRSGVVVGVTAPAVLPVAADRGLGAGQPSFIEEVAADALHRGGLPGHPHACARGQLDAAHRRDKRVARRRTRLQVGPLDGGAG